MANQQGKEMRRGAEAIRPDPTDLRSPQRPTTGESAMVLCSSGRPAPPANTHHATVLSRHQLLLPVLCLGCASSPERPFRAEIEIGPLWQSRNDAAVPGDSGTRFAVDDLTGSGPFPAGRFTFDWDIGEDHGLRAVAAPLEVSGTGVLDRDVSFQGRTFAAGQATKATYKFNTYRLTYRYRFLANDHWQFRVGATALVRDAEIELEQGSTSESDSNVGFVPLLHLDGEYRLSDHWRFGAEFDGLAGGPGRFLELTLRAQYDIDDQWSLGLGYRTLEGGADTDSVFAFAWLHSVFFNVGFRF
jgi:hypothetical protein